MVSAFELSEGDAATLTRALEKQLGSQRISYTDQTDPALLGGALIRAGDMVIDGSVRGRLDEACRAADTLTEESGHATAQPLGNQRPHQAADRAA